MKLIENTGNALVTAAKNIRIELSHAFPGVKFAIRSKRFSMGNSIDVSWEDGPTAKQVNAIIDKYQYGWFDGMNDLYNYHEGPFTYGSAKYVNSYRTYSDGLVQSAIDKLTAEYAPAPAPTVADFRSGNAWNMTPVLDSSPYGRDCWQTLINIACSEIDCTKNPAPKHDNIADRIAKLEAEQAELLKRIDP